MEFGLANIGPLRFNSGCNLSGSRFIAAHGQAYLAAEERLSLRATVGRDCESVIPVSKGAARASQADQPVISDRPAQGRAFVDRGRIQTIPKPVALVNPG